ncbi:3-deoxy-D-manno-octulosonic acid 8-phosphate synthase [Pseudomonas syringae pv. actinidiae]|uniref:3-deoxy-D-manno-octulosonic acid 8-phosphate synthase n=1 Tax=Pseudomonas syringae pv. actinidiae TaxID=103796 RepID=A0AAN4Q0D7_PSESF|nr:3-deoxy-D-manno-octulosonic acid 8-phosphate synthase [Pseudomonas syringae pv. actinidiae]
MFSVARLEFPSKPTSPHIADRRTHAETQYPRPYSTNRDNQEGWPMGGSLGLSGGARELGVVQPCRISARLHRWGTGHAPHRSRERLLCERCDWHRQTT